MAESNPPDESPVAASFREHLQAFHHALPAEEQSLLEQVVALAASATAGESDVQGFSADLLSGMHLHKVKIDFNQPGPGSPL